MGPLTLEQMEMFQKNPRFIGIKFPEMMKPETLEKKYLGKLSKKALSFIKACLKMDPAQRLTAAETLQHPYFEGLREADRSTVLESSIRVESAKPSQTTVTKLGLGSSSGSTANMSIITSSKTGLNASSAATSTIHKALASQANHNGENKVITHAPTAEPGYFVCLLSYVKFLK